MTDKGLELLKNALGEENTPFTDQERQARKNAAAFAIGTFSDHFLAEPDRLNEFGIHLTEEQIAFAKSFADIFPKPEDVLPKSEMNSARAGYSSLVSTPMFEIIPSLLKNPDNTALFGEYKIAVELMQEDPSGLSYIRHLLTEAEEKATISQIDLKDKEDDVKYKILAIVSAAKGLPETSPEKALEEIDLNDEEAVTNALASALLKAFGGPQNPKEAFVSRKRQELHAELPMEIGPDGKILPTDTLRVLGARLAFEKYQAAVNLYLNRWGNQASS